MSRIVLNLLVLLANLSTLNAENLVVGVLDPDEHLILESTAASFDTVLVRNQGVLELLDVDLSVHQLLVLLEDGQLWVENSRLLVSGPSILTNTSLALISDSECTHADLLALEEAEFLFENCTLLFPMSHAGQFDLSAGGNAIASFSNSDLNMGSGKLGGTFFDQAQLNIHQCTMQTSTIGMTLALAGEVNVTVEECTGGLEFVVAGSAQLELDDATPLVLWHVVPEGGSATFGFPPPNSVVPGASDVELYEFTPDSGQTDGIDYSIHVQNCNTVFWAVLQETASSLTIQDATLVACGLSFAGTSLTDLSGFQNDSTYSNTAIELGDRSLHLQQATVMAWNFYGRDGAQLHIHNSLFGEALGFDDSVIHIENSTCDGSGGYVGGYQQSQLLLEHSTLFREVGSAPVLILSDQSSFEAQHSDVNGPIVCSGQSMFTLCNTEHTGDLDLLQEAQFLNLALDSFHTASEPVLLPLTGVAVADSGPDGNIELSHFQLSYRAIGDDVLHPIAMLPHDPGGQRDTLHLWEPGDLGDGSYEIVLGAYNGTDSLRSCASLLHVGDLELEEVVRRPGFRLHPNAPNPFNPSTRIEFELDQPSRVTLRVLNMLGQELAIIEQGHFSSGLHQRTWQGTNSIGIPVGSGVYLLKLESGDRQQVRKMLLLR